MGYGLPVGARFVGTPRVGLTISQYGRDYRVGLRPRGTQGTDTIRALMHANGLGLSPLVFMKL
ncbi:MAG: hypothetical protein OXG35_15060 [Acidobacteria bacterium]|nr:hypothetical protein [Acidobacteriota bacterium]